MSRYWEIERIGVTMAVTTPTTMPATSVTTSDLRRAISAAASDEITRNVSVAAPRPTGEAILVRRVHAPTDFGCACARRRRTVHGLAAGASDRAGAPHLARAVRCETWMSQRAF